MGGRSRKREQQTPERWAFIRELSDDRLKNYGLYTKEFMQATGGQGGIHNKESFNWELAKEHERRYGYRPDWETSAVGLKEPNDLDRMKKELENEQARRSRKKS
jgi:hypothetical protein